MILHVDMDAFYASVEQRDDPRLRGKPVIVGGRAESRGVVSAASYEARQFGVHSAMPAATARRLCPRGVFLKGRIDHYAAVGREIRAIFERFTPLVEPLSLDEAFLDVTGAEKLFGPAEAIGRQIKQTIRDELNLVASVGVAPVKFAAKIASDLDKPDGFVVVAADAVQAFLDPLPIERLWGVGRHAASQLHAVGVRTVGQLRNLPAESMHQRFGKWGDHLWRLARGIDPRSVVPDHRAKQISHETTFAVDLLDGDVLRARLMDLAEQVGRRLRRNGLRGRTVHVKLRLSDFRTLTRSRTLHDPTHLTQQIWQTAAELLDDTGLVGRRPVRLLGVGVGGLDTSDVTQRQLFDQGQQDRQRQLDEVADRIQDRFGRAAARRAAGLRPDVPPETDV